MPKYARLWLALTVLMVMPCNMRWSFGQAAPAKPAVTPIITPEAVESSIARGVAYLYSKQKPDGTWEERATAPWREEKINGSQTDSGQWGGLTAMSAYALLVAGESPQDPRLTKAIEFLKTADIRGVYALGFRGQIWQYLPRTAEVRSLAKRDADILLASMKMPKDPRKDAMMVGKYFYLADPSLREKGGWDSSVSQYGVLGIWGAALADVEIPVKFWEAVTYGWLAAQDRQTGGWSYTPNHKDGVTATMTSAGVATLFITQDYLLNSGAIQCKGNNNNQAIDAGLLWLSKNFDQVIARQPFYSLYGVERVGVASGLKYFGSTDWYDFGVKYLLPKQAKDGGWNNTINTSFAVVFLSRGSAPVAISKLQYDAVSKGGVEPGPWNQRPRDIANLVSWMGNQIEKPLNWQIVNLQVRAEDLHDAPILYISGSDALALPEDQQKKLKEFIEQGGMVVGHADCGNRKFSDSFRDLGKKLFDSEFRLLPDDHLLYNVRFKRDQMKNKPRWMGLGNGARELMLLIDDDYGKAWQLQSYGGNETAFQMMLNLFVYAVGPDGARRKGSSLIVRMDPNAAVKRTIKVGRLQYDGGWDPEPGGWKRLAAVMLNRDGVKLDVQPVKPDALNAGFHAVHLTGTSAMTMDAASRQAVKTYVESGGMLVIDAAGGSGAFGASAEAMLKEMWPIESAQLDQTLPGDHALYKIAGKAMTEFKYRPAARRSLVGSLNEPRLRALSINDRPAVILSREDLGVGLTGSPVDGIVGYTPETATDLMRAILLQVK